VFDNTFSDKLLSRHQVGSLLPRPGIKLFILSGHSGLVISNYVEREFI
jgi:hypothetical protein